MCKVKYIIKPWECQLNLAEITSLEPVWLAPAKGKENTMLNLQSQWHLPLIFSYMGTLPFIGFTLLATGEFYFPLLENPQIIYFTNLSYAGLILFFMAGTDWGKALKTGHIRQYIVAMVFAVLGFAMLIAAMVLEETTVLPLSGFAVLFALFYGAEIWAHSGAKISFHNYQKHRAILTLIVVACLLLSTYFHTRGVSY